jgi:hypothetical protein
LGAGDEAEAEAELPADEDADEDPPHAVSSSSDPIPAAAAHPLLRITSLHSRFHRVAPDPDTPESYQTAGAVGALLVAT